MANDTIISAKNLDKTRRMRAVMLSFASPFSSFSTIVWASFRVVMAIVSVSRSAQGGARDTFCESVARAGFGNIAICS